MVDRSASAESKIAVPFEVILSKKRVMVALVFGQAGAANSGETPHTATREVYNFHRGKLYRAQDPLLGATGDGGSVWTRLGDKLIERQSHDAVVFVPVAVGGSTIARWQPGGDLHQAMLEVIADVKDHGLTITHMLWHQGESDAISQTSTTAYKSMFLSMLSSIRRQGVDAPILVSIATRCRKNRGDLDIRQAQKELADAQAGIYPGPDTDKLGLGFRWDGCHFSDEGLERTAQMWINALERAS
ncbi:MAG TPA: sialate O-acetylesterase [Methylomirabilota bacterium]|nr:sialate O-acetylesterase [Methylomirabilota bacterium]